MKVIGQIIAYLHSRGRLTRQELDYLAAEGFLRNVGEEVEYDWEDPYHCASWDPDEFLEASEADKERRHRRRSRPQAPKGALKAVEICDRLVERRPDWAETLSPILSLARRIQPMATLEAAPLLLRDADSAKLLAAMAAQIKASPDWFEDLWEALQFEEYRACCGRGGDAYRAYRAILTGSSLPEITKYAWILRYPEIAWVYTLIAAQRRLTRLCGALFDTQFALIDSYLAQTYRSKALWPYILLYSAGRYASGTSMAPQAQEARLPEKAMPETPHLVAAWELALEMKRDETLPFILYATGTQNPDSGQVRKFPYLPFLCPSAWYKPY